MYLLLKIKKMKKIIRLTEADLRNIVMESVNKVVECFDLPYISDRELSAMERAFTKKTLGQEYLDNGVKVVSGRIDPNKYYSEAEYEYGNTNSLADAIIELPNGMRHTLMKK